MEELFALHERRQSRVDLSFTRPLLDQIDFEDRLICISGARGSGKTTLLLQFIQRSRFKTGEALYITLDNLYFSGNSLFETARLFTLQGGHWLFIDEVHKYPDWSRELKNIYDEFPELKVVFTGSSILELYKSDADLSRRAIAYSLPDMSFREYLLFRHKIDLPRYSLEELLNNAAGICKSINHTIKPVEYFKEYLQLGCFPFSKENPRTYLQKLANTANLIMEVDIPLVQKMEYSSIHKLKKLLYLLAVNPPYTVNISMLSTSMEASRNTVLQYLALMERAGLLHLLRHKTKGDSYLTKPEKIYLGNPNLMYALIPGNADIGTLRELFFLDQLKPVCKVNFSETADFLVNETYTFEIGGMSKKHKQVKDTPHAFVVKDNLEFATGNTLPLWMFGFVR